MGKCMGVCKVLYGMSETWGRGGACIHAGVSVRLVMICTWSALGDATLLV